MFCTNRAQSRGNCGCSMTDLQFHLMRPVWRIGSSWQPMGKNETATQRRPRMPEVWFAGDHAGERSARLQPCQPVDRERR